MEASLLLWIDQRKIAGVAVHSKQSNIGAKADIVLKVAYLLLIDKIKIAENQTINSYLGCPEQAQTPQIKGKQENLITQYISVLACGVFALDCKKCPLLCYFWLPFGYPSEK